MRATLACGAMVDIRWVRSERVLWRRLADGVIVLPLEAEEPVMLAGSGAVLWDFLATPMAVEEAADAVALSFGITSETAEAGIRPFIAELAERAVVREAG